MRLVFEPSQVRTSQNYLTRLNLQSITTLLAFVAVIASPSLANANDNPLEKYKQDCQFVNRSPNRNDTTALPEKTFAQIKTIHVRGRSVVDESYLLSTQKLRNIAECILYAMPIQKSEPIPFDVLAIESLDKTRQLLTKDNLIVWIKLSDFDFGKREGKSSPIAVLNVSFLRTNVDQIDIAANNCSPSFLLTNDEVLNQKYLTKALEYCIDRKYSKLKQ